MSSRCLDIVNAHIVTLDEFWTEISDGFLRIRDGVIVALGPMSEYSVGEERVEDARGSFVFPGLINTHTHSFQALTRGIGEGLGVWDWFSQAIDKVVGHLTPEDARLAGQVTGLEAVMCGATTVLDYNYPHPTLGMAEETIEGMRSTGVRTVLARGILDTGTVHADIIHSTKDELSACRSLAAAFHKSDDDLVRVWFAPYTIFSTSPQALRASIELASEFDSGVTIHATTPSTLEAARDLYDSSDIAYEASIDFLSPRTMLVHCTHPEDVDLNLIAASGASVSHNPVSNAYLGEGIAPILDMRRLKINVCLGSDGPASNNNQDMLQVMKVTGLLQKLTYKDPSVLMARDIVWMATVGGAQALGWDHVIGSLEVGKDADLLMLNPWLPNSVSFSDPYATLVFSATQENIHLVCVKGQVVMRNRIPSLLDMSDTLEHAQEAARGLAHRAGLADS